jgi:hypothetical protein
VTTAFNSGNTENFVVEYTSDSHLFKIFIPSLSTSETVNLQAATSISTDRPNDCFTTGLDLVTSDAGDTAYSGSVFSEENFVLTIDTQAAVYESLFFKTLTYKDDVFDVDKVLVTVCGDQVITNADPTNAVFDIEAQKTTTSEWTQFSLVGIWTT